MIPADLFHPLWGSGYQFWSGIGSDLSEITLLAMAAGLYKAHNCHVHRCWRLARHPVDGTAYKVCRKHHPNGHVTAEQVREEAK